MGKMKDALVKLAKKITGKEEINKDSISNVVNEIAEGYQPPVENHLCSIEIVDENELYGCKVLVSANLGDQYFQTEDDTSTQEELDTIYKILQAIEEGVPSSNSRIKLPLICDDSQPIVFGVSLNKIGNKFRFSILGNEDIAIFEINKTDGIYTFENIEAYCYISVKQLF